MKKITLSYALILTTFFLGTVIKANAQDSQPLATDTVIITKNQSIVNGLKSLGKVESTKQAFLGEKKKLTKKAEDELKQDAQQMGGNIILVTEYQFSISNSGGVNSVHMVGYVFNKAQGAVGQPIANTLTSPVYNVIGIDNGLDFKITGCIGDPSTQTVALNFTISNPRLPDQKVFMHGTFINNNNKGTKAFDSNNKLYSVDNITLSGETKDNPYYVGGFSKELPAGLTMNGTITFKDVTPGTNMFSLVDIVMENNNYANQENLKKGEVKIMGITINWKDQATDNTSAGNNGSATTVPVVKNIDNGLRFNIVNCSADPSSSTATIYFTLTNPTTDDKKIVVYGSFNGQYSRAFDENSTKFSVDNVMLADETVDNPTSGGLTKELLAGLTMKGSITFKNVPPTTKSFALVNITMDCSKWSDHSNDKKGDIEIRGLRIEWNAATNNPVSGSVGIPIRTIDLPATQSWKTLGTGYGMVSDSSILSSSIAFSPDGTPYAAFINGTSNSNKNTANIKVRKYDSNTNHWVSVGPPIVLSGSPELVKMPNIVISPNGLLYLLYIRTEETRNSNVAIAKYDGNTWRTIGTIPCSDQIQGTSAAVASDGTFYLGYNAGGARVTKYNGTVWSVVGNDFISKVRADPKIAISQDGTLYAAYSISDATGNFAPVLTRFNGNGWHTVGSTGFDAHLGAMADFNISNDGNFYFGFISGDGCTIMKFNATNWTKTGYMQQNNSNSLFYSDVKVLKDGSAYFGHTLQTSGKISVSKFDGSSWSTITNSDYNPVGLVQEIKVAVAPDNSSVVMAYIPSYNNNTQFSPQMSNNQYYDAKIIGRLFSIYSSIK